ncbi:MAG: hypothetical protein ABH813_00100 [Patescibacteria group bacterium]
MKGVLVFIEPKISPLEETKVTSWKIINEKGGIKGFVDYIEFDITIKVDLSEGEPQAFRWKGRMPRRFPITGHYQRDKDISAVYQWVRRRLLREGLYKGRKGKKQPK